MPRTLRFAACAKQVNILCSADAIFVLVSEFRSLARVSFDAFSPNNLLKTSVYSLVTASHLQHKSGKIVNLAASDINGIAFNVPGIGWAILDTASNLILLPIFLYHLVGTSFMYAFLMWLVIAPAGMIIGGQILKVTKQKMGWYVPCTSSMSVKSGRCLLMHQLQILRCSTCDNPGDSSTSQTVA